MTALHDVCVETRVVVGQTRLSIREVLKLGRGAIITLDEGPDAPSELHVNGMPVAQGTLVVQGERVAFEVAALREGVR